MVSVGVREPEVGLGQAGAWMRMVCRWDPGLPCGGAVGGAKSIRGGGV